MKYRFKAFFQPFIMILVYSYIPYILNKDHGIICEGSGCSRIALINFSDIIGPQIINKIYFFILIIIPVIILLLTIISLFLGIKFLIIKNKYKKIGDQYYFEKLNKVTTAINKHTLIFLVFFIIISIPRILFSLTKDNPEIKENCIPGTLIGYKKGSPIFCE